MLEEVCIVKVCAQVVCIVWVGGIDGYVTVQIVWRAVVFAVVRCAKFVVAASIDITVDILW